ncbi:MAG TPA: hypothetical protein VGM74_06090 [Burkholderiaceae bacterium]
MLRILVAALLAANLAFFAWSQGWLDGIVGVRSIGDREPERMARQVHPELVRVLPPSPASGASAAAAAASAAAEVGVAVADTPLDSLAAPAASAPANSICLEVGPFNDAEVARVQTTLQTTLAGAAVSDQKVPKPGKWLVYMGRYANRDALLKKEEELKRRKLQYAEMPESSPLAPGLSLGAFSDRGNAARALDQFSEQDIHTARIVELVPAATNHMLRFETTDVALATRASALKLGPGAKSFAPCAKT